MHYQFRERARSAIEDTEQLSSVWQPKTKKQLQVFQPKEKEWKRRWKSGFQWNNKSWWTECTLGHALPVGCLTFQNWKKTQIKKPQSSTTALCASTRVQVACGWSNMCFLRVTLILPGEKLVSLVALPPCWLIYSLCLASISRKAICHFLCPWQRPLSVTQQPSKPILSANLLHLKSTDATSLKTLL